MSKVLERRQLSVNILCFELPPIGDGAAALLKAWLTRLEKLCSPDVTVVWPPPDDAVENARRAMWRGEPFLIAGDSSRVEVFLNGLDKDSARIVKDCAYCWFLSDSVDLAHESLPSGRPVALNWNHHEQNIVRDALKRLGQFPNLKGISSSCDRIRRDIVRIASGATGPSHSVLILGPSGCGKELVFQSLIERSPRCARPKRPTSGAWLHMEPGMAMTELVGLVRGDKDEQFAGLLDLFSDGSLFVDDFESAPRYIQETLLRIMEDEKGEYYPVGSARPKFTNAWLLFATNRNLDEFLRAKKLRRDFFYRFGTRIISIPPLLDRPADVPAIAQALWDKLWRSVEGAAPQPDPRARGAGREQEQRREPLRSCLLRRLVAGDVDWGGNTRTLRTALDLVVSMMRDPEYNGFSQADLVGVLLARGRSPIEWLHVLEPKATAPVAARLEKQIREADRGHPRELGPSVLVEDPLEDNLTPSEARAKACLTSAGWDRFRRLCKAAPPTQGNGVRVSVRLARLVWYVSLSPSITWKVAKRVTGASQNTDLRDLKLLADGPTPLLKPVPDSKPAAYERVSEMFN